MTAGSSASLPHNDNQPLHITSAALLQKSVPKLCMLPSQEQSSGPYSKVFCLFFFPQLLCSLPEPRVIDSCFLQSLPLRLSVSPFCLSSLSTPDQLIPYTKFFLLEYLVWLVFLTLDVALPKSSLHLVAQMTFLTISLIRILPGGG